MKKVKQNLINLINKGTSPSDSFSDQNRVRIMNFTLLFSFLIVLPVGLAVNIFESEWIEVKIISSFSLVAIVCYILNIRGASQVSFIILNTFVIVITLVASHITETQSAAPYGSLAAAVSSIIFFKKKSVKYLYVSASLIAFALSNYYQLRYNSFDSSEYAPVVLILILILVSLLYIDRENTRYQLELQKKNLVLKTKQKTIILQSENLRLLEKEKFEQSLILKTEGYRDDSG